MWLICQSVLGEIFKLSHITNCVTEARACYREGGVVDRPQIHHFFSSVFLFFKGKSDAKTPSRQKPTHKTPLKTPAMQRAKTPRTVGKTPKTPTANSVKRPSKKSLMTPSIPDRQQPCKTPGTPLELARKK